LFDEVVADDAQIYPLNYRFPESLMMTASGHAFVGTGKINQVSLLSGGAIDNVLQLIDTDVGSTQDARNIEIELKNTANGELVQSVSQTPLHFTRGCYVSLSGTNPRAMLQIGHAAGYGSDGAVRNCGISRVSAPRGV